jgi:hypothetical protein
MEPESSLPHSQEPAAFTYPKPHSESNILNFRNETMFYKIVASIT